MRWQWLLMAGMIISCTIRAQSHLSGTIMDSKSDAPLQGATIYNRSQNTYRRSTPEGKYSIIAREGDMLFFSSAGYRRDTINVSEELLRSGFDIGLKILAVTLDTVLVNSSNYSEDSLGRRKDYKEFYDKNNPGLRGGNAPSSGFGVSVSPISYFSRDQRAQRKFKKQLKYNEEQAYVDSRFSQSYVHKLTGLSGEELNLFMLNHRPSYKFVRRASQEDLLNYVNAALKTEREKK
jgi:hypothetical protein